ncbi:receptor-like protein 18 [Salvia hispanica]|uniref:receptor-like protein 18 n=1 Tax=Salvia hispanica TaxID=49212 RepID=UPI0020094FAC|nr:receptor-like protein 18 [Salvia hispanica]
MTGWIPDNISPNCSLKTLDVSHNNLLAVACVALEQIPREITCQKSWPSLQIIDIASNNFNGNLYPFNFTNWRGMVLDRDAELDRINLGFMASYMGFYKGNEVTLTIKGLELELVKIWPEFISIDFSCNNFHGEIPMEIGELNSLYLLNLSHNALSGRIPKSFGKLSEVESLDLSTNKLDGEIQSELIGLTFLAKLNLSMNNLVGEIPRSNQFSTFENDSYMGNLGLCGLPLIRKCKDDNGESMQPAEQEDDEDEFIDGFGWRSVVMGYGSGFVVGIGIGYMIIRSGRPTC